MKIFFVLFVLICVGAWILNPKKKFDLKLATDSKEEPWPYIAKNPLSETEKKLYRNLVLALPQCTVFVQVSLSQIVDVKPGFGRMEWNNKINRMSVDFLVCLKEDLSIVAAVELDDKSHNRADRIKADTKKDKALAAAGIPIVRWKTSSMPNVDEIHRVFTQ